MLLTQTEIEIKDEFEEGCSKFKNLPEKNPLTKIWPAKSKNLGKDVVRNKRVSISEAQMKNIKRVKVSVNRMKPPYCISCDKYYCSENELQNHTIDEHIKGYIEFMLFYLVKFIAF